MTEALNDGENLLSSQPSVRERCVKKKPADYSGLCAYFFGGLLPLPPPDGLPVRLGKLGLFPPLLPPPLSLFILAPSSLYPWRTPELATDCQWVILYVPAIQYLATE